MRCIKLNTVNSRVLTIIGTSRPDGNTQLLLDAVTCGRQHTSIELGQLQLSPYDYQHRNASDRFVDIAEQMLQCNSIVLATPVYWYAMSAQMKTFIDRLSDLVTMRKAMGRALAKRRLFIVVTSTDSCLPEGFVVPFELTANYLAMHWGGLLHGQFEHDLKLAPELRASARAFGDTLFNARARLPPHST